MARKAVTVALDPEDLEVLHKIAALRTRTAEVGYRTVGYADLVREAVAGYVAAHTPKTKARR